MIDTHCHLTYDGLYERADDVIAQAKAAGVQQLVTIATSPGEAGKVLPLAEKHEGVYAAIGVHPHYAAKVSDINTLADELRVLLQHEKVVAIGEMGLDLHYPEPPLSLQQQVFEVQLKLMKDFVHLRGAKLPGVIHNREATDHTLSMLRGCGIPGYRFVFHCFTGSSHELDLILDFGAMVGFTGITTFKSARALAECAKRVPMDRLLVETDAPYLTPEPHRKVKVNEPQYVVQVVEFIAGLRGMTTAELEQVTDDNARQFFGI